MANKFWKSKQLKNKIERNLDTISSKSSQEKVIET